MRKRKASGAPPLEPVAGNGLLHRRALLTGGVVFAGAMSTGAALNRAAAEPLKDPEWSLMPGDVTPVLQKPSRFEAGVVRILSNPKGEPRTQHARAPLQMLDGTITPNPLHFTILHSGIPDIDPGAAPLRHPRHGEAAAGIHGRCVASLSAGHAQAFRRVRRQQRRNVFQRADCRPPCSSSTGSCRAPNGPAYRCRRSSTKPASIGRRCG